MAPEDHTGQSVPAQDKVAHDFDRFAETYTQQVGEAIAFSGLEAGFFIKVKSDELLRLTKEHFGDERKVSALDLGCGIGAYHAGLADKFESLRAVDVSEQSLDYARRRNPTVGYDLYSGDRLPYEDNGFDLIFAICVLHHVPQALWKPFVGEMYRVTRPGGLAVIFEHNPWNPLTQYVVWNNEIDNDAVLLSLPRSARLLADAGFVRGRSRSILSVPPVNALASSLDRLFGHLPLGAQYYATGTK